MGGGGRTGSLKDRLAHKKKLSTWAGMLKSAVVIAHAQHWSAVRHQPSLVDGQRTCISFACVVGRLSASIWCVCGETVHEEHEKRVMLVGWNRADIILEWATNAVDWIWDMGLAQKRERPMAIEKALRAHHDAPPLAH